MEDSGEKEIKNSFAIVDEPMIFIYRSAQTKITLDAFQIGLETLCQGEILSINHLPSMVNRALPDASTESLIFRFRCPYSLDSFSQAHIIRLEFEEPHGHHQRSRSQSPPKQGPSFR